MIDKTMLYLFFNKTLIYQIIGAFLGLLLVLYLFWRLWFLRDPERKIPEGNNIVSPADGKIIEILEVASNTPLVVYKKYVGHIKTICTDVSTKCYIISIFMSPFNVHINRVPIRGKVQYVKHEDGKLKAVTTLGRGLENEKSEMLLKTAIGNIKVIQVAGFLARRIVTHAKQDQMLEKGDRYGLINLGSQLIVIVPKTEVTLKVLKGDKVRAGETILAEY